MAELVDPDPEPAADEQPLLLEAPAPRRGRKQPQPPLAVGAKVMLDDGTTATVAAADVLVTSCGNLGSLLAVLHWRGVTLQHPCTAQHFPTTTKAARRFLAFARAGFTEGATTRPASSVP